MNTIGCLRTFTLLLTLFAFVAVVYAILNAIPGA